MWYNITQIMTWNKIKHHHIKYHNMTLKNKIKGHIVTLEKMIWQNSTDHNLT